jgi:hypothetical protein
MTATIDALKAPDSKLAPEMAELVRDSRDPGNRTKEPRND